MAAKFEMDPQSAGTGLAEAGLTRSQALAAGVPNLPVGNYTAGYMTTLAGMLGAHLAEAEGLVAQGLAASAGSTATVEGTEMASTPTLTT